MSWREATAVLGVLVSSSLMWHAHLLLPSYRPVIMYVICCLARVSPQELMLLPPRRLGINGSYLGVLVVVGRGFLGKMVA